MSMEQGFDKLVQDLDDAALAGLNQAVSKEADLRREQQSVKLEDIHPNMSAENKARAKEQIARLLRGEE
jgi:hypothetical protein